MKSKLSLLVIFIALLFTSLNARDLVFEVKRTSYNSNSITGEIFVNNKFIAHSLELAWNGNQKFVSSIPAGTYDAILRYDKKDRWRIQLSGVPNRTYIQIHVGNYPSDIQGCILAGTKVKNKKNVLQNSKVAYKKLKDAFYGSSSPNYTPNINLKVKVSFFPQRTRFKSNNITLDYQDEGRWLVKRSDGKQGRFSELYRDSRYIYLSGKLNNKKIFIKAALFGGEISHSNSLNGHWTKYASRAKRVN
jgi:hypothetical protein